MATQSCQEKVLGNCLMVHFHCVELGGPLLKYIYKFSFQIIFFSLPFSPSFPFSLSFPPISLPQAYNSQCSKPILSVPYVSFIYSWLTLLFHIFPIFFLQKHLHTIHTALHFVFFFFFFLTWWRILMVSLFEYINNFILNDSIVFPYVYALI